MNAFPTVASLFRRVKLGINVALSYEPIPSNVWFSLLRACWPPVVSRQRIDWAARVGNYTYDQAVMDFGPPDKSAKLTNGTVVADWLTQRGYVTTYSSFGYWGYSAPIVTARFIRDIRFTLTFHPIITSA